MRSRIPTLAWLLLPFAALFAPAFDTPSAPELFLEGLVSTAASEVRIAFSPDGSRMLWGSMNREGGRGGWEIWESVRAGENWSAPRPAAFNSPQNDFDPSFSPDGRGVYFFSNRPGGLGGDDIWFASFDPATGSYGTPRNLGPAVNSGGDEWAPVVSPEGDLLLFASDGRGGRGLHDLFACTRRDDGWSEAASLAGEINSSDDDFDAAFLHDGRTIVFSRRTREQEGADLYVSVLVNGHYRQPRRLGPQVNREGSWNFGPSIHPGEPGVLYFTSHRAEKTAGRSDIYRVACREGDGN